MSFRRASFFLVSSILLTIASASATPSDTSTRAFIVEPDRGWRAISTTLLDIDRDGTRELAIGEVSTTGKYRLKLARGSVITCFFGSKSASSLPAPLRLLLRPDILAVADLDNDGHPDLVIGESGSRRLAWLADPIDDGAPQWIELPGLLRTVEVADIDRRDGLDELLVAVAGNDGSDQLLIYSGAQQAAGAEPESITLPSPITRLTEGRFADPEDLAKIDLHVEAGGQNWLVVGRKSTRDRRSKAANSYRQILPWHRKAAVLQRSAHELDPRIRKDGGVELAEKMGAVFTVNSLLEGSDGDTADGICDVTGLPSPSGICTLRAAVEQANATAGADTIQFALPGGGPHELAVGGPSPIDITAPVTVDGTSEAGFSGSPIVELNFSGGGIVPGLLISGDDVRVCGLSITGFPGDGLAITGDRAIIEGNWIGLDPAGVADGNLRGIGSSGDDGQIGATGSGAGNVIAGNTTSGVTLSAAAMDNELVNNRIGTNPTGLIGIGNGGGPGVRFDGSSNDLGGGAAGEENLVSGHTTVGVWITGDFNVVLRNDIGIDSFGGALGNGFAGIFIDDGADGQVIGSALSTGNRIRSTGPDLGGFGGSGIVMRGSDETDIRYNVIGGAGDLGNDLHGIHLEKIGAAVPNDTLIDSNLISGNGIGGLGGHGILLEGAENSLVISNIIGTSIFGVLSIPNLGDGIRLVESLDATIGGPAGSNAIWFNTGNGIGVHDLDASSGLQNTHGNLLSRNSLYENGALGIDLTLGGPVADGVTPNDDDDPDFGPNRLQNFPVLDWPTRSGGTTTISGSLNAAPSTMYTIELFNSPSCDPSGFGEAKQYLGETNVTTNGAGDATFSFMTPKLVTVVTATATHDGTLDTSELSACPSPPPGSGSGGILGDRVWNDIDGDGLQALEETGVAGVTVRLLAGASPTVIDTTTTDADGIYQFTGVATGSYRIEVVLPADAVFSPRDEGSIDSLDSDVDPSTGITLPFSYTAGTIDVSRDAGIELALFADGFESGNTTAWSSTVQ